MRTSKQHNAQPMQQPLIHRQQLCKSVGVQSSQCCIRHFLRLARTSSRLQRQGFIARRVMQACKGKAELQPRTCQHPFFLAAHHPAPCTIFNADCLHWTRSPHGPNFACLFCTSVSPMSLQPILSGTTIKSQPIT